MRHPAPPRGQLAPSVDASPRLASRDHSSRYSFPTLGRAAKMVVCPARACSASTGRALRSPSTSSRVPSSASLPTKDSDRAVHCLDAIGTFTALHPAVFMALAGHPRIDGGGLRSPGLGAIHAVLPPPHDDGVFRHPGPDYAGRMPDVRPERRWPLPRARAALGRAWGRAVGGDPWSPRCHPRLRLGSTHPGRQRSSDCQRSYDPGHPWFRWRPAPVTRPGPATCARHRTGTSSDGDPPTTIPPHGDRDSRWPVMPRGQMTRRTREHPG